MKWCRKDDRGDCCAALTGVLARAKAALAKGERGQRRVQVELVSGLSFIDEVMGVEGEGPGAVAVFTSQRRVAVADIGLVALELS
jgi:hypothetical protein